MMEKEMNEYIRGRINDYLDMLNGQGRMVRPERLQELMGKWMLAYHTRKREADE